MNANELRIGNLVYYCLKDEKYINKIGGIDIYSIEDNEEYQESHEPIPLTEEWLLKFGFVRIDSNYEKEWLLLHKNIKTGTVDFLLNEPHTGKYKVTVLEYVHQLQNLYFALTGEELEINNE